MKNKAPDVTTKFKRYLMLEKSLAANTVEAYMSDLKKLTDFIKASGTDMLSVSYHDLQEFAYSTDIWRKIRRNCCQVRNREGTSPKYFHWKR